MHKLLQGRGVRLVCRREDTSASAGCPRPGRLAVNNDPCQWVGGAKLLRALSIATCRSASSMTIELRIHRQQSPLDDSDCGIPHLLNFLQFNRRFIVVCVTDEFLANVGQTVDKANCEDVPASGASIVAAPQRDNLSGEGKVAVNSKACPVPADGISGRDSPQERRIWRSVHPG
jgi:hypothetical protein